MFSCLIVNTFGQEINVGSQSGDPFAVTMMPPIYLNGMTIPRASLGEICGCAAYAGFSGVELWQHHFAADDLQAADVDSLRSRYGARIGGNQTTGDVVSLAKTFDIKIDGIVPGLDLMLNWIDDLSVDRIHALKSALPRFVEIGARYVVFPVLNGDGPQGRIAASLGHVADVLAPFGLRAGLEPIGHVPRLSRIEDALEALSRIPVEYRAGLVLDAFHFFRGDNQLTALNTISVEQIVTVQINDAEDRPLQELLGHQHRLHPGHGIFDVAGFCTALLDHGYRGPFVAEVINEKYRQQDQQAVCTESYAACCTVLGVQRADQVHQ